MSKFPNNTATKFAASIYIAMHFDCYRSYTMITGLRTNLALLDSPAVTKDCCLCEWFDNIIKLTFCNIFIMKPLFNPWRATECASMSNCLTQCNCLRFGWNNFVIKVRTTIHIRVCGYLVCRFLHSNGVCCTTAALYVRTCDQPTTNM